MTPNEAKHLGDVLKAYSEGKSIEQRVAVGKWEEVKDLTDNIAYEFAYPNCFRIKPEPKYRPYANADEFLKAQKEHGIYLGLVNRREEDDLFIPDRVNSLSIQWVSVTGKSIFKNYNDLALNYAWQDGHPCGIVEE